MKHYILPVLLWTLAISQSFAQNITAPSLAQHFSTLPASVKNALRAQKQGVPTTDLQSRFNPLQLDSTLTFTDYDLLGISDSTPQYRTVYQYPQTRVKVETESQYQNDQWVPVSRTTQTSDVSGRVVEGFTEIYDSLAQAWAPESKFQVFPHANSMELQDSVNVYTWDIDQWVLSLQIANEYNAQDQLVIAQTTIDIGGEPFLFVDNYAYNAQQDNHLIESFLVNGGFAFPTGKQELMYVNHLLIQVIHFGPDGVGGFVPSVRSTYLHNGAQQITQENHYEWVPGVNDWSPTQTQIFEYDNASRLTVHDIISTQQGLPVEKSRVTYSYLQDQDLHLETHFLWNDTAKEYQLADRKYYYYKGVATSVDPSPKHFQALNISPNPAIGTITLSLESAAAIKLLNASGHTISARIVQPGEQLDLSALPGGIYQVTAQQGTTFYTGKVVKL